MGQGVCGGALGGTILTIGFIPARMPFIDYTLLFGSCAAVGLSVDFLSDCFAKEGKVVIHRDVVLNAEDVLRHVYTFYAPCESNPVSKFFRQKHEWVVLESHSHKYYTIQKSPANGNLLMDMRMSLRSANDVGLAVAGRPTQTGEIRQHRVDTEFDTPNDVSVAYLIAWIRKQDPRWAFSTENSRHFTSSARYAVNDF